MSDADLGEVAQKLTPTQILLKKYPLDENPYVRMHAPKDTRRRIFGAKEKLFESTEAEVENLRIASSLFREYLTRGQINIPLFGERVGKNMVRFIDRLNLEQHPSREKIHAINSAHAYYQKILGGEYNVMMVGFLAEYASMRGVDQVLKQEYRKKYRDNPERMPRVEYPIGEEDTKNKVDFWINLGDESKKRIAVQVKCLQLDEDPSQKLHIISNTKDLAVLASKIGYKLPGGDKEAFVRKGQEMLQLSQENPDITTAFITLPNPKYKFEVFNIISGLPTEALVNQLGREISVLTH